MTNTRSAAATGLPSAHKLRGRMEMAIERLISALDAIDDDPDLEEGHDAEAVNEDGGDIQDEPHDEECHEPSLGAVAAYENDTQEGWAAGNTHDQEFAGDDAQSGVSKRRLEAPLCGKPITAPEFTRGTVEFKGTLHPQAIAYKVSGDCLVPLVLDGDVIIVEPILPKQGEMAAVWPAGEGPLVKFVESDLKGWFPHRPSSELSLQVRLRMLNPPRTLAIDAAKIDRIWRVSQIVPGSLARFHAPALTGFRPQA